MRPFMLLIKPAGPDCNLKCRYCFYLGKCQMFGPGSHRMSETVLEKMVDDFLKLDFSPHAFAWQGGEPTLMGLDFFKKAVELQSRFGQNGRIVSNSLQTNAVLLDDDWGRFLHEYKFLLGVSLDGPGDLHDHYRRDAAGRGTFDRVMAGIETCRRHRVDFNILVLLNDLNVTEPDRIFDFLAENRFDFWQFIPCVERDPNTGKVADFSVKPQQYGDFMCRIFDRWLELGPEKISVRLFDSLMAYYAYGRHTNCTFSERCNDYVVVEHNGDVFCCDFFVTEQWKLGNILETPVNKLFESDKKYEFARSKRQLANKCIVCRYSDLCRGGCLKDRAFFNDEFCCESYLCAGYKQFFEHVIGTLKQLAARVHAARTDSPGVNDPG